ncbi:hypothetical protein [Aestuariivita boseongensis]|uniref:hypothetical protein n=1 Tax=Aestuariivita boseongensis TaxID=1470562 RepID=UPI0012F83E45|nr:hypothetical protein [Aestuariivita boseongensis]
MVHEWVLDVLADLQSFADANDLTALAAHLEEAGLIAGAELVAQAERVAQQNYGDALAIGQHPHSLGCVNRT